MRPQPIEEKKILEALKELPPGKLKEVLDFAEFLKTKKSIKFPKDQQIKCPTFHMGQITKGAFDRDTLYGEYLDQKFD